MANKKAVLGRPTPDASLPRNAFDRESCREQHYALGQLIPAWWEPVVAGTHMKLNRKIFQRTQQLKTAAFPIMDTHIQYYFVPYRQLWSLWDDFRLGVKDVHSSAFVHSSDTTALGNVTMPNRVPYTDIADLLAAITYMNTNSQVDIFGFPTEYQADKLLNLLGYGMPSVMSPTQTGEVNLWPLLAYHKIYYDHFRNTQYENNCAKTYNMDYLWAQNRNMKLPASELYLNAQGLLTMHYVDYRRDYFTNLYPSLNYVEMTPSAQGQSAGPGNYNVNPLGLPSTVPGAQYGTSSNSFMGVDTSNTYATFVGHTVNSSTTSTRLTMQTLRSAFAYDKLLRSSAYAPQHIKDQYEARYGIKFKKNDMHSIFVGAFKNDIQIGEVTSTANTGTSGDPLGAIGGKGVSFADWGKTIEFNADEDGIIMAVMYTTLRSAYRSLGLDSYLVKHLPEDYFVPEYQNLGLEPVYGQELNIGLGQTTVLGYRPRNQRYKLGIDKSYGLFSDMSQDLSMFINHTDVNRLPTVGQNGVNYAWFKLQPSDLNGIMAVDFDGTWATDQFFGQVVFGATMIQNMSVHGQPSL